MNKTLIATILLATMLGACSSKPVKEEPKAAVEDKSPMTSTVTPPAQPSSDSASTSGASTMSPSASMAINPLKDPSNILSKRSIYFDFDKYDVKPEFRSLVEAHANYLKQNAEARVMLQGNADDRGSREYNLALGQYRSVAVKSMMNLLGVSDRQIETVSYGEEKPRCSDTSEPCRSENRRADIVYVGEE